MRAARTSALLIVLAALAGACPTSRTTKIEKTPPDPTTVAGDKTPALPATFTPLPWPGEPDPPPPDKRGLVYLSQIHPRLRGGWRAFINDSRLRLPPNHPLNDSKLAATLEITLNPKGKLEAVRVSAPSGNQDFDKAAVEILRDAAPFPPANRSVVSDDDRVHLRWLFARDRRLAGIATAKLELVVWPLKRSVPKFIAAGNLETAAARLLAAVEAEAPKASKTRKRRFIELGRRIAVAGLRQALASKEIKVQRVAVAAAAMSKAPELAPQLRKLATTVVDHTLGTAAVHALGEVGNRASIPLLKSILRGERGAAGQRAAAAMALARLGASAIVGKLIDEQLASADKEQRWQALSIAASAPVPAASARLARMVRSRSTAKAVRVLACSALGKAAARGNRRASINAMLAALRAADASVRAACADALATAAAAGIKSRAAFWRAVELLQKDPDERVRAGAVLAAARLEPRRMKNAFYLLRRERSLTVVKALARALAPVPGRVAYRWLIKLAGHRDQEVRLGAVRSLLERPEKGARKAVAKMIGDSSGEIRLLAIGLLDAQELAPHLGGRDGQVRMHALIAYARLKGKLVALPEILRRLRATRAGSPERARVAAAWLAPKRAL